MPGDGRPAHSREVTKATVNLHDLIGSLVMVAISHSAMHIHAYRAYNGALYHL